MTLDERELLSGTHSSGLLSFPVRRVHKNAWLLMVLGTNLNLQLMSNLFRHLVRLPMVWFEKRHIGDVVSRFDSLNTIQRTLTTSALEAMIDESDGLIRTRRSAQRTSARRSSWFKSKVRCSTCRKDWTQISRRPRRSCRAA